MLTRDLHDQQTFRGKETDGAGPCVCHPPSEDLHSAQSIRHRDFGVSSVVSSLHTNKTKLSVVWQGESLFGFFL